MRKNIKSCEKQSRVACFGMFSLQAKLGPKHWQPAMPTLNHRGMPMIEPRCSLRRQLAIEDAPATTAADPPARAVDATAVHTPAKAPCPPHAATWHAMSSGGGTFSLAPAPSPWASSSVVAAVAGGLSSHFEGRNIVEQIFVRGRKPAKARALTRANVN